MNNKPNEKTVPNPGSSEAIEQGCICAVWDNHYGRGRSGVDGSPDFFITGGCPLHAPQQELEIEV